MLSDFWHHNRLTGSWQRGGDPAPSWAGVFQIAVQDVTGSEALPKKE
jgi:hypothetical protein